MGPSGSESVNFETNVRAEGQQQTGAVPSDFMSTTNDASSSRRRAPIKSLRDGLFGCPLEAISAILPEDFLSDIGRTTPERFVKILVHSQF
jgi:hypothetical protein